jgi:glutamate synthase domain-containing protein 2
MIPLRYSAFALSIGGLVLSLLCLPMSPVWGWPAGAFAALTALGTWDLVQRRHTVSRNYPILAHLRYFLESIGPEMRQYFIQSDTEERPFSREQRSVVYQRAKRVADKKPFGSQLDMYAEGYEWISPSLAPAPVPHHDFRLDIGGERSLTYSASILNVSALSFGALSGNAIRALNAGAAAGQFFQDTGEGSISSHHRHGGGDLVWQIASGYFGCRRPDGGFDPEQFKTNAGIEQVRMIEIKLSQGAKPGHGGILPAAKVTPEIAHARGVPVGEDVVSPASHSAFRTPRELMQFIGDLRDMAGGKPVGIKLALGHPWEWFGIVKAMLATGEHPDFIVVDGGEGGTGAAPLEFINRLGTPLDDAVLVVHNTLVAAGLRERIRLGAAGKITSAFHIARTIALGADWCNAGRGFMFSLGCIQALSCHTDHCPSGVATQDPRRGQKLDVTDKAERVRWFHENTVRALAQMLAAAGLNHPSELGPEHIMRRIGPGDVRSYATLFHYLEPHELETRIPHQGVFQEFWPGASADSFDPPEGMMALRQTKLR